MGTSRQQTRDKPPANRSDKPPANELRWLQYPLYLMCKWGQAASKQVGGNAAEHNERLDRAASTVDAMFQEQASSNMLGKSFKQLTNTRFESFCFFIIIQQCFLLKLNTTNPKANESEPGCFTTKHTRNSIAQCLDVACLVYCYLLPFILSGLKKQGEALTTKRKQTNKTTYEQHIYNNSTHQTSTQINNFIYQHRSTIPPHTHCKHRATISYGMTC